PSIRGHPAGVGFADGDLVEVMKVPPSVGWIEGFADVVDGAHGGYVQFFYRLVGSVGIDGIDKGGKAGVAPAAKGGTTGVGWVLEAFLPAADQEARLWVVSEYYEQIVVGVAGQGKRF